MQFPVFLSLLISKEGKEDLRGNLYFNYLNKILKNTDVARGTWSSGACDRREDCETGVA